MRKHWVGFDLDGTLAEHQSGAGIATVGKPVPSVVNMLKLYLHRGVECRIMTARAGQPGQDAMIKGWLIQHGLPALAVTNQKDYGMLKLYDDRAEGVVANKGIFHGDVIKTLQKEIKALKRQLKIQSKNNERYTLFGEKMEAPGMGPAEMEKA